MRILFPGTALSDPLRAKSRRIADSLVSFKGLYGRYSELAGSPLVEFFHYFFACFSILHFFAFLSQNTPQKGAGKCQKAWKSTNKPPPDPAWKPYLQKASPECENRIRFNVLSLFPKVPGIPKSIANWTQDDPGPAICEQTGHPKKQQKTSRQKVINFTEMVANWGPQGRPKFGQFVTFSELFAPRARNGPGVVPGSKKGRPRRPKGAKRLPEGSQKSWKSYPQGSHKASKSDAQATKQPSNKATTQRSDKATKQQSNQATKQPSNKATKQQSHKATQATQAPQPPQPNALSKSIRNSIGNSISNAMANAIANATANAMATAVTDHGTVAGRPKATG